MTFFILILLLYGCSLAHRPPSIESDGGVIQKNHNFGRFLELSEHETLVLRCSGVHDDLMFVYPNLDDNTGYEKDDYQSRITEEFDDDLGDRVLTIEDVKVSDAGYYGCKSEKHSSLNDTIYVFVKGSSVFIPLKPAGFMYKFGEAYVPCKATSFIDKNDIELYGNGELIKNAHKQYNHAKGFKLTKEMYEIRPIVQVPFECKFTGRPKEATSFLITERDAVDTSENDYRLYWEESTEWPYVGINYTLTCHLSYSGTGPFLSYVNSLHVDCPQCSDNAHAIAERGKLKGNSINANIQIGSLNADDSGEYSCRWTREGRDEDVVIRKSVDVAPKRGQIKIIERSPELVRIKEGEPLDLSAKLAVYPKEKEEYSAKWIRKFTTPIKEGNQSEPLINDEYRVISNDVSDNFTFLESLEIKRGFTKAKLSGSYILSVVHSGTVQNIEWQVAIDSRSIDTRISIREPSSFVVFEQPFYPPNTKLHIDCIAETLPPARVSMQMRSLQTNSPFVDINPAELQTVSGTFQSGYIWSTEIFDDIEVQCIAIRGAEKDVVKKQIRIADQEPTVTRKIIKSERATKLENPKEIYEGDSIELDCILPHDSNWEVRWIFDDNPLEVQVYSEGYSKHIVANLRRVSPNDGGKYTCLVTNGPLKKQLHQNIQIEPVSKPYHTQSDPTKPVVINYGESAELVCGILGNPMPDFTWLKDGKEYQEGEIIDSNLKITRVRAEDEGEFTCRAENRAGTTDHNIKVTVAGAPEAYSKKFVLLLTMIILVILCCCCVALAMYGNQKRKSRRQKEALDMFYNHFMKAKTDPPAESIKMPIDQRVNHLPYRTEYELNREDLEIGEVLGSGNFGVVYSGFLRRPNAHDDISSKIRLPVAVKAPLNGYNVTQQKMLAEELKIMCTIGKHPNVLALVGAVTKQMRKGELYVVVEMCENGNLLDYLHNNKGSFVNELKKVEASDDSGYLMPNSSKQTKYAAEVVENWESQRLLDDNSSKLSTSDLISFSMQIANGMEYLSQVPCVHRDLAARNVLLTSNKICRVADFGMARRHDDKSYYRVAKNKEVALPFRWMPIEAIEERKYTQESDVWSFGIVLYEIFTLGGMPYPTVSNTELLEFLHNGNRNSMPQYCHDQIYELMLRCWEKNKEERPTFSQCVHFLKQHVKVASPMLLERLEDEIRKESEKQRNLESWLPDENDSDPRSIARSSAANSPTQNSERIYIPDITAKN